MVTTRTPLDAAIREAARPITGTSDDFDSLLDLIGDARLVLLGEATHGTHEFYRTRARITRHLIEGKGFCAVAAEADWPDAWRVNRSVRGVDGDTSAEQALAGFKRFPQWMWRNTDVRDFVTWLQSHNAGRDLNRQAGFYGLDLYSLNASMHAVIQYLDQVDPAAAQRARQRYACFEHFGENNQAYGYAAVVGTVEPCEDAVIAQLVELQKHAADYATRDGRLAEDEYFYAEQNARVAMDAEEYYRIMFRGGPASWNLRDQHMAGTLDALLAHLDRHQRGEAKIVVWEHNSHIGDARATELSDGGEINVGQLVRERYGDACRLIGFSTDHGTVTAASDWDMPAERKQVRPALPGSFEALFHDIGVPAFSLNLSDNSNAAAGLRPQRLERAIGVVYRPETERWSHYFHARLSDQFDAVIHFDETHAVEPLARTTQWEAGEVPETFPSTF